MKRRGPAEGRGLRKAPARSPRRSRLFEHARPLRADRPPLPAEARGVPPRAVTWRCGHLGTVPPAEALTCERAPAWSPTPHPSARPRSPAPLSLGAHGARDTAPSALPVDTGQILCLSTGAPHSPRHPAGDPECPPPHPCPQTCVQAYARLSFWKKLWWRGEPTGLGANPGSCTSYGAARTGCLHASGLSFHPRGGDDDRPCLLELVSFRGCQSTTD